MGFRLVERVSLPAAAAAATQKDVHQNLRDDDVGYVGQIT